MRIVRLHSPTVERLVSGLKLRDLYVARRTAEGIGARSPVANSLGHLILLVGSLAVAMAIRSIRLIEVTWFLLNGRTQGHILPASGRPSAGYQLHALINIF